MMKNKLLLLAAIAGALALGACNGGGSAASNGDIQTIQGTYGTSGGANIGITGTATGCRVIPSTGTCTVSIVWEESGISGQFTLDGLPLLGASSTISNCGDIGGSNTSCTFSINTSNADVSEPVTVNFVTPAGATDAQFIFGGG